MTTSANIRIASFLLAFFVSVSLIAQAPAKPVARSPAAHRPVTTTHAPAKALVTSCPIPTVSLSPKIPALAPTAGCAKGLYTLAYIDTEIGSGELAAPRKFYTVHYTGYLPDGTKFDSSFDHPGSEPIVFPYGARQVIPGWDTGFEGMHVGGKRRLFIPYQLAYGETGRPPTIPGKAELIFDVQLVSMSDQPPAPKTPASAPAKPGEPAGGKPTEAKPAEPAKPATPPPTQSTTPATNTKPKS